MNWSEFAKTIGAWAAWLPVAWYDFIKNHPARAAIVWPLTLAIAVWWL